MICPFGGLPLFTGYVSLGLATGSFCCVPPKKNKIIDKKGIYIYIIYIHIIYIYTYHISIYISIYT